MIVDEIGQQVATKSAVQMADQQIDIVKVVVNRGN